MADISTHPVSIQPIGPAANLSVPSSGCAAQLAAAFRQDGRTTATGSHCIFDVVHCLVVDLLGLLLPPSLFDIRQLRSPNLREGKREREETWLAKSGLKSFSGRQRPAALSGKLLQHT